MIAVISNGYKGTYVHHTRITYLGSRTVDSGIYSTTHPSICSCPSKLLLRAGDRIEEYNSPLRPSTLPASLLRIKEGRDSDRYRMGDSSNLAEELLSLLNANESGLSDEQISNHFGPRYGELVAILNDLLSMNRLQLFTQAGVLIYKLVREETAAKFEGLG